MKEKKKKRKYIVALLVGLCILAGLVYCLFSRNTAYTRYTPFQRSLFSIDPASDVTVKIQSGSNGEYYELASPAGTEQAIALLNQFRYRYWVPSPSALLGMSGWSHRIILTSSAGRASYVCTEDSVEVGGVLYFGDFTKLFELFSDHAGQSSDGQALPD